MPRQPREDLPRAAGKAGEDGDRSEGSAGPVLRGPLGLARIVVGSALAALLLGPSSGLSEGDAPAPRLDLPASDRPTEDEEEDLPEIIFFYDNSYEGDAFFFCCDYSKSMHRFVNGRPKIQVMKEELIKAIGQMSSLAEFGIVAFHGSTLVFRDTPVQAGPGEKAQAVDWLMSVPLGFGTCLATAGVRSIHIARRSSKEYRAVIILSDGLPWCSGTMTTEQCLRDITAANIERIPVHTIYIPDPRPGKKWGGDFLRELAARNGGTFKIASP